MSGTPVFLILQLFGYLATASASLLIVLRMYVLFPWFDYLPLNLTFTGTTSFAIWNKRKIIIAVAAAAWGINVIFQIQCKLLLSAEVQKLPLMSYILRFTSRRTGEWLAWIVVGPSVIYSFSDPLYMGTWGWLRGAQPGYFRSQHSRNPRHWHNPTPHYVLWFASSGLPWPWHVRTGTSLVETGKLLIFLVRRSVLHPYGGPHSHGCHLALSCDHRWGPTCGEWLNSCAPPFCLSWYYSAGVPLSKFEW